VNIILIMLTSIGVNARNTVIDRSQRGACMTQTVDLHLKGSFAVRMACPLKSADTIFVLMIP